jgi:maleylpyruvate isomerase
MSNDSGPNDSGSTDVRDPEADLRWVADAQQRFQQALVGLDDVVARRPSLLDGWSVGHVITHVARNADSHTRRVEAAKRDEIVDQYVGGYEGRAAEIELGAGRSAAELVQDVTGSAELLEESWGSLSKVVWAREVSDVAGRTHVLSNMPSRRWRELEIHLVDLDIGPTWRDWPDEFVSSNLPLLRPTLESRLHHGSAVPALDERDELAWLTGRLRRVDLPDLLPWD